MGSSREEGNQEHGSSFTLVCTDCRKPLCGTAGRFKSQTGESQSFTATQSEIDQSESFPPAEPDQSRCEILRDVRCARVRGLCDWLHAGHTLCGVREVLVGRLRYARILAHAVYERCAENEGRMRELCTADAHLNEVRAAILFLRTLKQADIICITNRFHYR